VKVLHADLGSDVGRRFERERAVRAELSGHSAVVPLLEAGKTAAGQPYALSPFYSRGSLARLVADHGRLGWREATFLLEPVAVAKEKMKEMCMLKHPVTLSVVLCRILKLLINDYK